MDKDSTYKSEDFLLSQGISIVAADHRSSDNVPSESPSYKLLLMQAAEQYSLALTQHLSDRDAIQKVYLSYITQILQL